MALPSKSHLFFHMCVVEQMRIIFAPETCRSGPLLPAKYRVLQSAIFGTLKILKSDDHDH